MRAGQLDRRVTIQKRSTVKSGTTGAVSEMFADLPTLWARKLDPRGREVVAARQVNGEATDVFEIRWRAGITELDRIIDGSRVYDILHVAEIGRRRALHLSAKAKTS